MKTLTIGIVGNPNCGKTTLFNILTGARQRVGNWPGVTVDRKSGYYAHNDCRIEVVDTPGIYSLSAGSADEEVTTEYILSGDASLIVNIVDASNIERNLYLTSQIMEMGVPMLIALNMMDMAKDRQIEIDVEGLSKSLGLPIIPITASKNQGITQLKEAIQEIGLEEISDIGREIYPVEIQDAITAILPMVAGSSRSKNINTTWLAVKLLENDNKAISLVDDSVLQHIDTQRLELEGKMGEDADIAIASAHYGYISRVTNDTVKKTGTASTTLSDRIDHVALNRIFGIPIFLCVMYLMFMFTINLGGAFIDFFDIAFGAIFVDGFGNLLQAVGTPDLLKTILANGIGGGIQTMATFIPPVGFMFIALSFLEDSGYMARAAFVMDRFMRVIGLPGKSFIPMLVGFGCNVPAIMATRTLENERDRTLTIMMNPFMSCGARLPVYALFAAAFWPVGGQNLVFLLYLIGIGFAVITGLILKNTLLKGDITPFVMELPPYHLPTFKSVLLRAYDRLKTFIFRASKVLIPVIAILAVLNCLGTDGSFGNEDSENSVLASMSKSITPILRPLGVTDDNWPATVGIFTGIFAKEAVVGTINSLYSSMDTADAEAEEDEEFSLAGKIGEAFGTIPANLADLGGSLLDPMGLSVGNIENVESAAEELEVDAGTIGSMAKLFGSKAAAFAYLLFILLYFPCSAAIAAVYRETNLSWTLFAGGWTTFMAYTASTLFYQVATFSTSPMQSLAWILGDLTVLATVVWGMWMLSAKREKTINTLAAGARA
jgi:ferrous iron transport protein B